MTAMSQIRSEERSQLVTAFETNTDHVHVYGEPGIGKSTLVKQTLNGPLSSVADKRITVRETFTPEMAEKEVLEVMRDLAGWTDEKRSRTAGLSVSILGIGGGGGRSRDERERDVHKLESLLDGFEKRAVLWLDDVQKLSNSRSAVRDYLAELSEALPDTITLFTSGRTPLQRADTPIELQSLSAEETGAFLGRTFSNLSQETAEELHERVDGHPYYLDMLLEAADSPNDLVLPDGEEYNFIENEYLDTLSPEEERFVRQASPLSELDESLCAAVIPELDRAEIRQTLSSLRKKAVVRDIDRNDAGERIYSMHDLFQECLYDRLNNEGEIHRRAFQYYVRDTMDTTSNPELAPMTSVGNAIFARHHIRQIYSGEPSVEDIQAEFDRLELTSQERRVVLQGIGLHIFDSSESRAELVRAETTALMKQVKQEADVSEPQSVFIQIYFDLLPAALGTDTEETPVITQKEYHDELMEDVRAIEWDDAPPESIQMLEDSVSVTIHGGALVTALRSEEGQPDRHKEQLIGVVERYGVEEEIAQDVATLTRDFLHDTLPGFDIESSFDPILEDLVSDAFGSGSTRQNLQTLQDTMPNTLLSIASAGIETALAESEEVFEYFSSVEQALSEAENPFFVAFWSRLCERIYTVLGPNEDRAEYFEKRFERAKEQRIRYEESLENPVLEIEEDELLPQPEFAEADPETGLEELVDFE